MERRGIRDATGIEDDGESRVGMEEDDRPRTSDALEVTVPRDASVGGVKLFARRRPGAEALAKIGGCEEVHVPSAPLEHEVAPDRYPPPMSTSPSGREMRVTLADGRVLALFSTANQDGPLVLHNHGGPSSRWEVALFASAAEAHGLHLVGVDRPGMGASSPQKTRTFRGWAEDLTAVADHLGARTFGVTGWSEGGPWALGSAAWIPRERLRHVTTIAGGSYGAFGPNWAAADMSKIDALGGRLALHFRPGFRLMYEALELTAVHFRATYLEQIRKAVSAADRAVLADAVCAETFLESSIECFAQGADGLVRDATALYESWDIDLGSIARPVHFWQGLTDLLVPPIINEKVAAAVPGAIWHTDTDAGHFVAVSRARDILAIARDELLGSDGGD